jgi:glycerate kinase
VYRDEFGVDVADLPGAGAAGGLAGGLAALGGRIVGGFDLVADELGLHDTIADADLVITGEGHLDAQSFDGKVVGGVAAIAAEFGVPVVVICGVADDDVADRLPTRQLVEVCGLDDALNRPIASITRVATDVIRSVATR